jgi:4-hydroxy-tetrahydrodipicolinate synthase
MKDFSFNGDYAKASKELFRLLDINGPMYEESNPVGLKALLTEMGICKAQVRLPLVSASEGLQRRIKAIYQSLKK